MIYGFTLADLAEGERAQIKAVRISGAMRRRMLDIGFVDGAEVTRLFSGASGEPTAFMVNGAVTALRAEDMRMVEVAEIQERRQGESMSCCRAWV